MQVLYRRESYSPSSMYTKICRCLYSTRRKYLLPPTRYFIFIKSKNEILCTLDFFLFEANGELVKPDDELLADKENMALNNSIY